MALLFRLRSACNDHKLIICETPVKMPAAVLRCLLILSDLHHEHWREHAPRIDPAASRPDVVILAVGIDTGAKAMEWAERTVEGLPVLYVHGNHEGHGQNLDDAQDAIQAASAATKNVRALPKP